MLILNLVLMVFKQAGYEVQNSVQVTSFTYLPDNHFYCFPYM